MLSKFKRFGLFKKSGGETPEESEDKKPDEAPPKAPVPAQNPVPPAGGKPGHPAAPSGVRPGKPPHFPGGSKEKGGFPPPEAFAPIAKPGAKHQDAGGRPVPPVASKPGPGSPVKPPPHPNSHLPMAPVKPAGAPGLPPQPIKPMAHIPTPAAKTMVEAHNNKYAAPPKPSEAAKPAEASKPAEIKPEIAIPSDPLPVFDAPKPAEASPSPEIFETAAAPGPAIPDIFETVEAPKPAVVGIPAEPFGVGEDIKLAVPEIAEADILENVELPEFLRPAEPIKAVGGQDNGAFAPPPTPSYTEAEDDIQVTFAPIEDVPTVYSEDEIISKESEDTYKIPEVVPVPEVDPGPQVQAYSYNEIDDGSSFVVVKGQPKAKFQATALCTSLTIDTGYDDYGFLVEFENGFVMGLGDVKKYQNKNGKLPSPNGTVKYGKIGYSFQGMRRINVYNHPLYIGYEGKK